MLWTHLYQLLHPARYKGLYISYNVCAECRQRKGICQKTQNTCHNKAYTHVHCAREEKVICNIAYESSKNRCKKWRHKPIY